MRHIQRGGTYLRVADPTWSDPMDGAFAAGRGGRWNPPRSFGVTYLCASIEVARANVWRRLADQPYGPEDLAPASAPVLATTRVPTARYVDVITRRGCESAGLPPTYPRDGRGRIVPHERCQPIGSRAWEEGEPGIACRSAAPGAPPGGEELAFFARRRRLRASSMLAFERWFW
jgi:hypothetical protein